MTWMNACIKASSIILHRHTFLLSRNEQIEQINSQCHISFLTAKSCIDVSVPIPPAGTRLLFSFANLVSLHLHSLGQTVQGHWCRVSAVGPACSVPDISPKSLLLKSSGGLLQWMLEPCFCSFVWHSLLLCPFQETKYWIPAVALARSCLVKHLFSHPTMTCRPCCISKPHFVPFHLEPEKCQCTKGAKKLLKLKTLQIASLVFAV